jgi:hypothetical protein
LQDLALTVRHQLVGMPVPFCAFNGGADVFVDIGVLSNPIIRRGTLKYKMVLAL